MNVGRSCRSFGHASRGEVSESPAKRTSGWPSPKSGTPRVGVSAAAHRTCGKGASPVPITAPVASRAGRWRGELHGRGAHATGGCTLHTYACGSQYVAEMLIDRFWPRREFSVQVRQGD
jgi:hypothetical protein